MKKISIIIASGQSVTQEQVDYVRSKRVSGELDLVIAVSNVGIDLLPDADILVSHDSRWWQAHPEALKFKGEKYSRMGYRRTKPFSLTPTQEMNSGLMAMYIARNKYKVTDIILLGFDMHGTHYFGPHTREAYGRVLDNTQPDRFAKHIKQFDKFSGCAVYNATPNSALYQFQKVDLYDII